MPLPPIDVVDLFPEERASLLSVLDDLSAEEWEMPTVCTGWSVKDVALHILGSEVGIISRFRDGFSSPHFADGLDISTWDGLLTAINRQNDYWTHATRRISPQLLLQFLRFTGDESSAVYRSLDPFALGGPVDWAGPGPAPLWMHISREYTERWVHQQHIRDAVGRPGFTDRRSFHPVLDAFARAIPHVLRETDASYGTLVRLTITGEAGGSWTARSEGGKGWSLIADHTSPAEASVEIDQDLAWRLFTKGVTPEEISTRVQVTGDRELARPVIHMVSIIA